jgi:hypothetical protein
MKKNSTKKIKQIIFTKASKNWNSKNKEDQRKEGGK